MESLSSYVKVISAVSNLVLLFQTSVYCFKPHFFIKPCDTQLPYPYSHYLPILIPIPIPVLILLPSIETDTPILNGHLYLTIIPRTVFLTLTRNLNFLNSRDPNFAANPYLPNHNFQTNTLIKLHRNPCNRANPFFIVVLLTVYI